MKLYGGIDLHSNNSVIVLLDANGDVLCQKKLGNHLSKILTMLKPYQEQIEGLVVESTYNWYWLVDGLIEAGYIVHLANTTAIQQYSGLKYADDNSDARWLAEMLRLGSGGSNLLMNLFWLLYTSFLFFLVHISCPDLSA